jgi:segregation and condensation protein B
MVNPDGGGPSLGPRAEPISSHDERRGVSVKTSQVGPGSQQKSKNAPELKALVESLLFVAEGPVTAGQLARALEVKANEVEDVLTTLAEEYRTRGLRLQRDDGRVQIVSAPEAAFYIEQFLGLSTDGHLSTAALETLATIAYQQPVTRAEIEAVRGVDCGGVLRTLLTKGFITQLGRLEQAGRPIIYGTTFQFLCYFGLESLDDLPPVPQGESMSQWMTSKE